ncbi:MAG TPA: hypothetical protein VN778_04645, partial [Verrucomicrobiae bacterium]|nr:hypothetical protein [Verrucomicrobiae bacterium]
GQALQPVQPSRQPVVNPVAPSAPAPDQPEPPAPEAATEAPARPTSRRNIFKRYWYHKLWTLPLTVLAVIGVLMAVPTTRYLALAHFISRPFTVTVTDSTTNTPISGATVKLDGHSAQTDSKGRAAITVPVGDHMLLVSETYYKSTSQAVFVDVSARANSLTLHLLATGRQVPLKVVNKITGQAIPEVEFTIGETTARSDLSGMATVVLPADSPSIPAVIKADGYNTLTTEVQVTTKADPANTFALVPVGRIYFLSNTSGAADLVSTNLDGSGRKTVIAGDPSSSQAAPYLTASHDWRYLALFTVQVNGDSPKLSLVDTSNDKVTTIDTTAAVYTLAGWSGHNFIYTLDRSATVHSWQPNQQTIMTYNADTKQAKAIVNSAATGTSDADAVFQKIGNVQLFGGNVIYTLTWMKLPDVTAVSGQADTLISAKADGTGSRTLKSVDAGATRIDSLTLAAPDKLYFAVIGATSNYYRLDVNGNTTQSSTITSDSVSQSYPVYDTSPSGAATAWMSAKSNILVGDASGNSGSVVNVPAGFVANSAPYGWFSDSYLLLRSSNLGSLYVVAVTGGTPLKIADNISI